MGSTSRRQITAIERVVRIGVGLSVSLLAWPAEDDLRRQMSTVGQPRLLIVDAEAEPPMLLDPLEDWVRAPSDPADVQARATALLARAPRPEAPVPELDEDGLLRVGSSWVVITPAQVPVLQLLVDNLNRVVRTQAIAEACTSAGASAHPPSMRTLLSRLGGRVRSVGMELVTVRQRGVLLRMADPTRDEV